ncbi:lipoprotein-releasing ABC transporter permease subunit [Pinisolibacter sp.]|uniref:lipoprotein-releasing ABC transporter permease subunit n=1 Tax=Pinisolibacter sp. TaxID=2172024 RepID=UPI002FDCCCDE
MSAATDAREPSGTRPFAGFEWMLAWRYLRSRRRETFISIIAGFSFLGIMLGVATLIVVMAVMNGFRTELVGKILGLNGHMLVQATASQFTDYTEVAERLGKVKGVKFAMPFIEGQALASGPAGASGALVRGLERADLDKISLVSSNVKLGSLDDYATGKGVAIGSRLAQNLGVGVGDPVTIVSPRGNVTPMGVTPRVKAFPVVAIFSVGMSEYDASFVFMPFTEAQSYFNLDGKASAVEVYVDDPDKVGELRAPIEAAANRSVYVTDWRQRNVTFFSALEVERNVMFLILMLIVLVAALNIVSGMTMLVKDKARDVAILRTMGATRGTILRVFFITGAAIGTAGTFAGLLLGLFICQNIEEVRQALSWLLNTQLMPPEVFFLSRMKADIQSGETTATVVFALTLSLLATLYPAWKAAKLDPVEALRYE